MKLKYFISAVFLTVLFSSAFAGELKYPSYYGYVNDFAGILDPATAKKIEAVCKDLEAKTSAELAVAVVKTVAPLDSKTYAVELFKKWGIGKKGKDNGILILLTMEERRIEIEVGYGLEGIINDARAGQILDEFVVPYFKEGKYGDGLYNCAVAISQRIMKGSEEATTATESSEPSDVEPVWLVPVIVTAFVLLIILSLFASGLASGFFGTFFGAVVGYALGGNIGGIIGGIIGFVLSFVSFPTSWSSGGGGSGGWSSGGGGGWSSSSGSSFGGGSSGGGGAGRSF